MDSEALVFWLGFFIAVRIVVAMVDWYWLAAIEGELRQHRKVAERVVGYQTGGHQPVASGNIPKPPQGGSVAKRPAEDKTCS